VVKNLSLCGSDCNYSMQSCKSAELHCEMVEQVLSETTHKTSQLSSGPFFVKIFTQLRAHCILRACSDRDAKIIFQIVMRFNFAPVCR
jgi:hypothetical protein